MRRKTTSRGGKRKEEPGKEMVKEKEGKSLLKKCERAWYRD